MDKKERKIYAAMKERGISTLALHRLLGKLDIVIPQKTLQTYLNDDFEKASNSKLKTVALGMIKNHDDLIESLSEKLEDGGKK